MPPRVARRSADALPSRERTAGAPRLAPRAASTVNPAILARPLVRQLKRIAGWTLAWTLFQWWAVIGWPDGAGGVYAGAMFVGFIAVVTGSLWRDLRAEAQGDLPARVIPLPREPAPGRRHPSESEPAEDLAA